MSKITIRNAGPIKNIENLEINSVNVFMGHQSSGKSTIAKIISYCAWVEKNAAVNQSLDEFIVNGGFRKKLEDFHRLNGYFNANTEINYESDVINLRFRDDKCSMEWIDKYAYKRSKIEYIPSERNLIVLPFIQKIEMPNNNNRSFLFDWLTIRSQYNKENKIKILNLPVEYYFDENTGENHIISTDENDRYDILLENASSGLQSLIPLIIAFKYLTGWIYENEEEISFEKQQTRDKVFRSLSDELIIKPAYERNLINDKKEDFWKELVELVKNPETAYLIDKWNKVILDLGKTQNTRFIIEEPEQNLFPSTQRDLIYHLLSSLNLDRGDTATITTHSPYILYALNNCMMGYLVNSQLLGEEKNKYLADNFLSEKSWINPQSVSIWEIEDGVVRNIQDKDNIITENYFDDKMTELTDEYYQMLHYYKNEN